MRRLFIAAALLLAPRSLRAQEICGDLTNNADPSSTHLVDEGCNPAAVTGVCESPISCGKTGAVAPKTGQLVYNEPPDIAPRVPFGPPLSLGRNYASLAADQSGYLGSLGKGWRHSFMGWLDPVTSETDEVIVRLVTGQEVLFTFDDEDPTSTYDLYTPQPGYHVDTLRRHQTSDVWELITLDGWTYEYDDSSCGGLRMLVRIEDPFGQGLSLTYNGSCYLTDVTDGSSYRSLHFTYDNNNKLDKVDYYLDGTNLQVTVDYTVTSDKLEDVSVGLTGSFTLIRDYTWTGNKLDLIEDGDAKNLLDVTYIDGAAGKVARLDTGSGNIGYRYGDTNCDGGEGLYVFYNDLDGAGGCDADGDCGSGNFCGGEITPGTNNTGVCYRARRCVALSSSHDDLVDSVTSSCPTCTDTKSYLWDTSPGLDLIATHDADDVRTTYARNADGLVTRVVENDDDDDATNTPPSTGRTTYFFYDSTFWGRVAEVRRKSELLPAQGGTCTDSDTTDCKQTLYSYEATSGNGAALVGVEELGYTYEWVSGAPDRVQYDYLTTYDYDAQGRLSELDGPRSGYDQTTFAYFSDTASDHLDAGMLQEVSRATGSSTALTTAYDGYDYWGNATSIEDPNGNFTCRTFDADLDVLTVDRVAMNNQTSCATSNSADLVTTTTYDSSKRVKKIERPLGNCVHRAYDAWGRLSTVKERDDCTASSSGHTMELTYNDDSLAVKTEYKDASGTVTYRQETTYDDDRRLLEIINPAQTTKKKTLSYEPDGMLASVTGEDGVGITEWGYDPLNRANLEQRHLDATNSDDWAITNCKQMDRVVDVTDADDKSIERTWDDMRRTVAQVTREGGTSYMIYDEAGNLVRHVEAFGSAGEMSHLFTYDSQNRSLTEDYGDEPCFSLGGAEIQYTYDTTSGCPPGACENVAGRLAQVKTKVACDDSDTADDTFDQFTYFKYDDAGRTVKETITDDGGRNVSQNYAWDKNGNQTLVEAPSGIDMKWTYGSTGSNSDADKVTALVRNADSTDTTFISSVVWNPFGPIKEYQQANTVSSTNIVASFTLDLAYRPSELRWHHGTTDDFKIAYTLDAQGRITARDFSAADSNVQDAWYLYDWQDRILCDSTTAPSGSTCPSGNNRKNQLTGSPPYTASSDRQAIFHRSNGLYSAETYTYNYVGEDTPTDPSDDSDQIDSITKSGTSNDILYGWDHRGNRLYDDDQDVTNDFRDYTYDGRSNLVTVTGHFRASAGVLHNYTLVNAYDHRNRRFFKSFIDEDASPDPIESQWFYYYDLQDRLIEVNYTPDINHADTYQLWQFYWIASRPVARVQTSFPSETHGRRFTAADHLDTPLDGWYWPSSGNATRAWAYNPDAFGWGRIVHGSDEYQPLRFPGQVEDDDTLAWRYDSGTSDYVAARPPLRQNRYRVYDPLTGSYLQADPKVAEGWQSYAYVDNNPVMHADPQGLGVFGDLWDAFTGGLGSLWNWVHEGGDGSQCGGYLSEAVPDRYAYLNVYFDDACGAHDECYRTCCKRKSLCDEEFAWDLAVACAKSLNPLCWTLRHIYLEFIQNDARALEAYVYEQVAAGCSGQCGGPTPPPLGKPADGRPASCYEFESVDHGSWDFENGPIDPEPLDPACLSSDSNGMLDVFAN
jgi:RHS repeat-associated protein